MASRRAVMTAALAATALTLGGCSLGDRDSGEGDVGSGQSKTAKVVVIAPMSGSDAARGLGVRNSVQLTVDQANASGAVPGWTLSVEAIDDESEPAQAKTAAQKAAGDDDVVAVIGSIYSGLTKEMLPVLAPAGIPALSPSATNPTLTKGEAYATKPVRAYTNFFPLSASDDAHGPAVARYLAEQGATRVATVDDGDTYGAGLAQAFTAAHKGKVVSHDTVEAGKSSYPQLVAKLLAAKPQAVFFGGYDTEAAPISLALKQAGLRIPVAGGDGLATDAYIPMSGPISAGDISTMAGKPVDGLEAGKKYLADYAASVFAEGGVELRTARLRRGQRGGQGAGHDADRLGEQPEAVQGGDGEGAGHCVVRRHERPGRLRRVRRRHPAGRDGEHAHRGGSGSPLPHTTSDVSAELRRRRGSSRAIDLSGRATEQVRLDHPANSAWSTRRWRSSSEGRKTQMALVSPAIRGTRLPVHSTRRVMRASHG